MDADRFDRLARSLSVPGTRRRLVWLLAALPLGVTLTTLLGADPVATARHKNTQPHDDDHGSSHRRQRRRARNRHQPGQHKDNPTRKRKRTGCKPKSDAKTCAGMCATVVNNCGKLVNCGPCTCATGCPQCQTCNTATGRCDAVTNGTGCDDGNACTENDTCQSGVCTAGPNAPNRTVCAGSDQETSICCNGTCWDGCCGDGGAPAACRVFVTADPTFLGEALGGLSGADAICQDRATNRPSLPPLPGTYKAWLSSTTDSPVTRFRHAAQPYELLNGDPIANNFAGLLDRSVARPLLHAIDRTELDAGIGAGTPRVWTGTLVDGTAGTVGQQTCNNWSPPPGGTGLGRTGRTDQTNSNWTSSELRACNSNAQRLFCFQQD